MLNAPRCEFLLNLNRPGFHFAATYVARRTAMIQSKTTRSNCCLAGICLSEVQCNLSSIFSSHQEHAHSSSEYNTLIVTFIVTVIAVHYCYPYHCRFRYRHPLSLIMLTNIAVTIEWLSKDQYRSSYSDQSQLEQRAR